MDLQDRLNGVETCGHNKKRCNSRSVSGIDRGRGRFSGAVRWLYDMADGKSFRSDDLNESLLLPRSLHDWLPEAHLARFLVNVLNALDLAAIYAT